MGTPTGVAKVGLNLRGCKTQASFLYYYPWCYFPRRQRENPLWPTLWSPSPFLLCSWLPSRHASAGFPCGTGCVPVALWDSVVQQYPAMGPTRDAHWACSPPGAAASNARERRRAHGPQSARGGFLGGGGMLNRPNDGVPFSKSCFPLPPPQEGENLLDALSLSLCCVIR